ncbi:MAG: leucine--tRNA ligase [Candidatus Aenigmatarchaeota archaeon]|nr:MAG: leucine--tRNA ligase [Candidatus Aenigmarchaeota archaeon]
MASGKAKPDFASMEAKWQRRWEESGIFKAGESKKKCYVLEMFPYPSAAGLHMGHIRNYSMGDAFARFRRMQGFSVLYPMGYDAFGLPAENAAIKHSTHPKEYTEKAIEGIKKNQKALGLSYDWSREIATCRPEYYKWNQWFFTQMLKKGLAYKKKAPVNWCDKCGTVLANEQVEGGKCWRCKGQVEAKNLDQWFFKITDYADELLKNLDNLEWPESIKTMQRNWIGRSEGTLIEFPIEGTEDKVEVFTTRPDTLYGVTFMLYAPEHPKVLELVEGTGKEKEVKAFINKVMLEDRFERTSDDKEKEGMFIGRYCVNPVNNEKVPIYIANFVLPDYGTGAVMAVPAHDQRDFEFAKKFGIPVKVVIKPHSFDLDPKEMTRAYMDQGTLINSGEFNGSQNYDAIEEITEHLKKNGWGRNTVQYKLRDWLISRQRYWGTPIPVIYCNRCGMVPVPDKDLPVELPLDVKFTGKGNPLASLESFVNVKCPECGGNAKRETDTMDTFVDSSWYFLRYCSPRADDVPFRKKDVEHWMPVDQYIGGAEHAVMHLLYARFFTMVLRDMGLVKFSEPFTRLFNQGIVYKDGHKMSKSFGNVVTQKEIAKKYGIDTARLFLLFVASPDSQLEWSDRGIVGSFKFLMKVRGMFDGRPKGRGGKLHTRDMQMQARMHSTIKSVTESMEGFAFNKAIGSLMSLFNYMSRYSEDPHKKVLDECKEMFTLLLSPFAPHTAEDLWEALGRNKSGTDFACIQEWPKADEKLIDPKLEMMEQLTGRTREDIKEIIRLVGKEPEEIFIYVSPLWKYEVHREILAAGKGDVVKTVMKNPKIRKEGKAAVRFAEKLAKEASLGGIMSQEEEMSALRESSRGFGKEFGCKVSVMKAEEKRNERSLKAEPGKPGIEIV